MPPDHDASTDKTGEGRLLATTHLSHARVMLDLAAETLEDYEIMWVPERAKEIAEAIRKTRDLIDHLADDIMEPFGIADVLKTIEEVQGAGETVGAGTILRATVDARQDAMEEEERDREPTDDQLANRPGMEGGISYPITPQWDPSLDRPWNEWMGRS